MIINTHRTIKEYAEAYKQASDVYNQAVAHIRANYKEGSELYENAMNTAENTFNNAVKPIKEASIQKVNKELEEAKKAISESVGNVPSANIVALIPLIKAGKLSKEEFKMFIGDSKINYMDAKLLYDAMDEHFTTADDVMDSIRKLQDDTNKFFDTYSGENMADISYNNALLLNGSSVMELDRITEEFLNTYCVSEGDAE